MITKEQFIADLNNNRIDHIKLITEYCIEKGKTVDQIQLLLQILPALSFTGELQHMLDTAIKYYKDKFEIITISWIQDNSIIKHY